MDTLKYTVEAEEARARKVIDAIRATLQSQEAYLRRTSQEIAELKKQKLEAVGWREKQEIDDLIASRREQHSLRQIQDSTVLVQPYFGVLELSDDDLGELGYCLGRQSFFDGESKALVIDWREAPISRLYYEYDSSEQYEEEIRGKDRSGTVRAKRKVEIVGEELRKIVERETAFVKDGNGWSSTEKKEGVIYRKEEQKDHRLPEITALISPDQFRAIARPESSTAVLQGGAGSGKTTVGLHRIAFLNYQDPHRFKPENILIVVYNRSLRLYISKVLVDLGIGSRVNVETYHSWAGKIFRAAGLWCTYSSTTVPGKVARLKKSSLMLPLIERYLDKLLEKSTTWLGKQVSQYQGGLDDIASQLKSISRFEDFYAGLIQESGVFAAIPRKIRHRSFSRLLDRLKNHIQDLRAALSDREILLETAAEYGLEIPPSTIDVLADWERQLKERKMIDYCDTAILLYLIQKKGVTEARPWYSHAMADEAQDLSEVELTTLFHAVDERQSITICGDMAQKIKGEFDFSSSDGFAGFVRSRKSCAEPGILCADTLTIGYRATKPIMELAWHVIGKQPSMDVRRDGEPVRIIQAQSYEDALEQARTVLANHMREHPSALVAVVCLYKADADRVFEDLEARGLGEVRRHSRDNFVFTPGVIVTNSNQIKGLEFSAVLVFNPSETQYRDDRESRMLLHVVLTRAADSVWIIGYEPMAYGLGEWTDGVACNA